MIAGFLIVTLMALCALCCMSAWAYKQLVAELRATEYALARLIAGLSQDLTSGLLALRDDAVTRISDIQQAEPRVVTVEVPTHAPAPPAHDRPVVDAGVAPKPKRAVDLIFLDCHEAHEVGRTTIDPFRRAREMKFNGSRYVCVRGNEADGFTYRQED